MPNDHLNLGRMLRSYKQQEIRTNLWELFMLRNQRQNHQFSASKMPLMISSVKEIYSARVMASAIGMKMLYSQKKGSSTKSSGVLQLRQMRNLHLILTKMAKP